MTRGAHLHVRVGVTFCAGDRLIVKVFLSPGIDRPYLSGDPLHGCFPHNFQDVSEYDVGQMRLE